MYYPLVYCNVDLIEKLIVEAARASWFKNAVKARIRSDCVELFNDKGEAIYTALKCDAPSAVLNDFRNAVRN